MACEVLNSGSTISQRLSQSGGRSRALTELQLPLKSSPLAAHKAFGGAQDSDLPSSSHLLSSSLRCPCTRAGWFSHKRKIGKRLQDGGVGAYGYHGHQSLHRPCSHSKRIRAPQALGGPPGPRRGRLDTPSVLPEVEIITRDGVIKRNARPKEEKQVAEMQEKDEEKLESSGSIAEGFAAQQKEAARAQLEAMRKRAEEYRLGKSDGSSSSQTSVTSLSMEEKLMNDADSSLSEEENPNPMKARIEAMKKKALEYKAAKAAPTASGDVALEGTTATYKSTDTPLGGVSSAQDSSTEDPEVDPVKARIQAMKKKALEYKAAKSEPSVAGPTPPPQASSPNSAASPRAPSSGEEPEGGGMGAELAMLMLQRRRTEPSPYANVIQPLQRPSEEDMPEVEIVVGSGGEAMNAQPSRRTMDEEEAYKPKVATWGVFPRPQNISQAYGGGRTIRPGEPLISEEEKAARDQKTMALIDAYKKKMGIEMDAGIKEKADKALGKGLALMERGALRESIAYFDEVIQDTPFRSEVHGQAMLNKAVTLDSMGRPEDAKPLYEKLGQHPKVYIQRKAGQMLFGFVAAEKLKFSNSHIKFHDPTVYQKYLDRFSNGYDNTYAPSAQELEQNARDAGKSQLFALAMVGAPLVMIGALIAARSLS